MVISEQYIFVRTWERCSPYIRKSYILWKSKIPDIHNTCLLLVLWYEKNAARRIKKYHHSFIQTKPTKNLKRVHSSNLKCGYSHFVPYQYSQHTSWLMVNGYICSLIISIWIFQLNRLLQWIIVKVTVDTN